jgi:transposase InsO family protein
VIEPTVGVRKAIPGLSTRQIEKRGFKWTIVEISIRFLGKIGSHAKSMASVEDARQAVTQQRHFYNTIRLHNAIGYVTPYTKVAGKDERTLCPAS